MTAMGYSLLAYVYVIQTFALVLAVVIRLGF